VIIEAANGQDLLDQIALEKRSVNLCILDVNMPLMNGIETAYSIKSKWPAIKIIGYSLEESNREIMINKGADAFLLKDCNSEVMSKTILEIMSK
jgi:DNA-binding NarL/FixJ family response regulator